MIERVALQAKRPGALGPELCGGVGLSRFRARAIPVVIAVMGCLGLSSPAWAQSWVNCTTGGGPCLITGSVGIGTASPSGLLHVSNAAIFNPSVNVTPSILAEGYYGGGVLMKDGTGYLGMWSTGGGSQLNFKAGGTTSGFGGNYGSMVLTSAGNLGIGTTTPTHTLSVNGVVQAKEVIVNTGWSDYVFEPGYALSPLTEVATYISEHHHLPGIPSEAEVRENGAGLGEMQVKLLAKIEELTLHMIQEHARNDRLERQNGELQGRIEQLEGRTTR